MLRRAKFCVNYLQPNLATKSVDMPSKLSQTGHSNDIYTVSRLTREARRLLEGELGTLWIEGEISNMARPASGHIYFSLKDGQSQVRCAMFRGSNRRLNFEPDNGSQVLAQAKVGIYEARGEFQLVVEKMEDAGEGRLRRKFEELKQRLSEEGLFDESAKQELPALPASIGVVTSASGAALRDILNILKRRYPAAPVIVYPSHVQGEGAAKEIAAAINTATVRAECDVLIVARGGGSLEDLWSFNEEIVARAIYACTIPTVAGVGHEVDVTIADLVADVRAPTPSGAAELVAPDRSALLASFRSAERRGALALQRMLGAQSDAHSNLQGRLTRVHPGAVVQQARQRLDDLVIELSESLQDRLNTHAAARRELTQRLRLASPQSRLRRTAEQLKSQRHALAREIRRTLEQVSDRLATTAGSLNTVSPLATLERGYAIVQTSTGELVRDAQHLKAGDKIQAKLARGLVDATVDKTKQA